LKRFFLSIALAILFSAVANAAARIKDITAIQGVRDNQLIGYGLVVGLAGTGDSLRGSPFTEQSMRSMLEKMGVSVPAQSMRARNVAAVVVTASLPPFIGKGARIDISVSSLGDASSLAGGTLLLTPLIAVDGNAYAVAQGPIAVSGFAAAGQAESVTQGVPTTGRVPNGALIERELTGDFNALKQVTLQILNPDFATAVAISDAINAYAAQKYKESIAQERNLRTVVVTRPKDVSASRLMAEIGDLIVEPDTPARIVIDERTGTIVIGAGVKISRVAVTHGSLTVRVTETPNVSQPPPLSPGETVIEPNTEITTRQDGGQLSIVSGPSLEKLVDGLNRLGLKPSGIIAIVQAIKTAGAMHAELVVQ
jgi:flagellar P-ring protein precursor FlgI